MITTTTKAFVVDFKGTNYVKPNATFNPPHNLERRVK